MKVLNIIENDDGSANLDVEMSQEEMRFFLEYAIVDILKKSIEKEDNDGQ